MKKLLGMKKKESEAVKEFCSSVKKALGNELVSVRLFGSKARRTARKDSDIDVAVVVRERNSRVWDKVMDAAFAANIKWDVYISPRVIARNALRDPKWRVTGFVKNLEREGIPL